MTRFLHVGAWCCNAENELLFLLNFEFMVVTHTASVVGTQAKPCSVTLVLVEYTEMPPCSATLQLVPLYHSVTHTCTA